MQSVADAILQAHGPVAPRLDAALAPRLEAAPAPIALNAPGPPQALADATLDQLQAMGVSSRGRNDADLLGGPAETDDLRPTLSNAP